MTMQQRLYWGLIALGLAHVLGGLLLVMLADTQFLQGYIHYLTNTTAGQETHQPTTVALLALFGPTVASWGLLFCVAVDYYYRSGKTLIKWICLAAILLWLVLDCAISGFYGFYWHWLINGCMGVALVLPLCFLRSAISPIRP